MVVANGALFLVILHLVVGSISFILTLLISLTLWSTKKIFQTASYKLMLQLNLAFLAHSVAHFLVGVNILIGNDFYFKQILGALQGFSWVSILIFMSLLAFERMNITVFKCKFSLQRWRLVVISLCAWLSSLLFFGILVSPLTFYYFEVRTASWNYAEDLKSTFVNYVDTVITFTLIPATFVVYVVIYVHLVKQRTFVSTESAKRVFTPELRMLFASSLTFLYQFFDELLYKINDEMEFNNYYYNLTVHLLLMGLPIFSQLVHLAFNRTIRRNLMKRVLRKKSPTIVFVKDHARSPNNTRRSNVHSISTTQ